MTSSQVLYTVSLSLSSVCMAYGGARHLYYIEPEKLVMVLKYNFGSQPLGAMASAVGKSSVAFLMLRVIGPNTVWRKRFLYFQLVIYMAITIVSIIVTFAQCSPPRALWEMVPGSKCWNPEITVDITILQSGRQPTKCTQESICDLTMILAYGTFMDFLLAAFPITILRGLKINLQQKIGLGVLLSLGVL